MLLFALVLQLILPGRAIRTADEDAARAFSVLNSTSSVVPSPDSVLASFPEDFFFGLATAAAHVEEAAPGDSWVEFAKSGNVAAYSNQPNPDVRLKFWSTPEVEIDLAAATGVTVFRLGVDWSRLVPEHPVKGAGVQDRAALQRYKEICQMVRARGMKVMLTLFHHALPTWSANEQGWMHEATADYFLDFAKDVATELKDVVDYWVTFNEPHVFVLLTYCARLWPHGHGELPNSACLSYKSTIQRIERTHADFYMWAHRSGQFSDLSVGVAHNVAFNHAHRFYDSATKMITERLFKMGFSDGVRGHLDFLGLNYYGKEVISGNGVAILDDLEYSDSGRAVYPTGLYDVLMQFHQRYESDSKWPSVVTGKRPPIFITENGISDASDVLRPAYITEHLLAIREAMRAGANIGGYIHWTISDNWEWADGYCPKFGLVDVDRSDPDLKRTPRDSYEYYTRIAKTKTVTVKDRQDCWDKVQSAVWNQDVRPFCRSEDGVNGLDEPTMRPFAKDDWRFTGLSQAENGCYFTPWEASDELAGKVVVSMDGSWCRSLDCQERLHVSVYRFQRCNALQAAVKEVKPVTLTCHSSWKNCLKLGA